MALLRQVILNERLIHGNGRQGYPLATQWLGFVYDLVNESRS